MRSPSLGLGIGWRDELAAAALERRDLGFIEVLADRCVGGRPLPEALEDRGIRVVLHSVGLSLGGADRPERGRIRRLAALAERTRAPMVSDHIAFVRLGRIASGHLLPVPYTKDALQVMVDNVRAAQAQLPVPLALEPIATLVEWPNREMEESDFICELLDRTGALLLLDVANVYANARNHGFDPEAFLARLPLERIAYVHVAGGTVVDGLYQDTHAHAVPPSVLRLLAALAESVPLPGVMLERDDRFPRACDLNAELSAIARAARIADDDD